MKSISVSYALKYAIKNNSHYQFTDDGKCFNMKTGRQIKQVYVSRSIGYCINGKFQSLSKLRKQLVKIKKENCPF